VWRVGHFLPEIDGCDGEILLKFEAVVKDFPNRGSNVAGKKPKPKESVVETTFTLISLVDQTLTFHTSSRAS
jgi:hypothetical protein